MDNEKYFYVSGFLSLSLFIGFCFLFIILLFSKTEVKTFGLQKKNYISVSLNVPTNKIPKNMNKIKSMDKGGILPLAKTKTLRDLDVNELFSDVWTQKIRHKEAKPKKVNAKRLAQLQKRIKTVQVNTIQKVSETIKDIHDIKTEKERSVSAANEVNEYLAKIQALVYQYFYVPQNTAGYSVKAVIELDPYGKVLDFRVLEYSTNNALNEEVDRIKHRLLQVVFPKNPQHVKSRTIVILKSKE